MAKKTPGEIIGKLIEDRGITAYRLAHDAGVDPDTVRLIVTGGGSKMTLEMFRRLCAALGENPAAILDKLPPVDLTPRSKSKK